VAGFVGWGPDGCYGTGEAVSGRDNPRSGLR